MRRRCARRGCACGGYEVAPDGHHVAALTAMAGDPRPLVLHVVHRFDTGGLENGLVNLINHMPQAAYRHAVLALTEVTEFKRRVRHDDVRFIALGKPPGQGLWLYPTFMRVLSDLRPTIVHTRNLGTLEFQLPAALARVRGRVHGEHGRDIDDLDGSSLRHRGLRRLYRPFVHTHVALSRDLAAYLTGVIGVAPVRVRQIYNGVDTQRFSPVAEPERITGCPFSAPAHWVVGTVGRMVSVKNQTLLANAFVQAAALDPLFAQKARLVMIGGGDLLAQVRAILDEAGLADHAWLPGERSDVPDVMRGLNCFVLPSLAEGVSNTILEAMASGLPVVATRVGGNDELVTDGQTGHLVPSGDVDAMARALIAMARDRDRTRQMGLAARREVERRFSMPAMAQAYCRLYDDCVGATAV